MIEAKKSKNFGKLTLNGKEYDIYIARSEKLKSRGLLGFESLPDDEGMLFVLNEKDPIESWFHMQNVPFPLDMIFMDDDFKVLSVKTGKPNDPTPITGVASYVLEINGNSGVKEGDEVSNIDDEETDDYVMKVLDLQGKTLMSLKGGERIISRKETKVLIRKALKANDSQEDRDYKSLGKYIFKVLKGLNERPSEYVESPKNK